MRPLYVLLCLGVVASSVNAASTRLRLSLSPLPAKPIQHCPINQVYKECKGCELRCEDIAARRICTDICISGCGCADGYVKNPDEKCVRQEDCPDPYKPFPELPLAPSPDTCSDNEVYRECKGCDQTCDNPNGPISCPRICLKGCACKEGFVRDEEGKCIQPLQCKIEGPIPIIRPRVILLPPVAPVDDSQECPANEVYSLCKKCEQGCPGIDPLVQCTKNCRPGCSCEPGFVRSSGFCIPSFQCPQIDPVPIRYPPYPPYPQPPQVDPLSCPPPNPEPPHIDPLSCPPPYPEPPQIGETCNAPVDEGNICPANEKYKECGGCEQTCKSLYTPMACAAVCIAGCQCQEGYVRDNGVCIPSYQCPQIDPIPFSPYPNPYPVLLDPYPYPESSQVADTCNAPVDQTATCPVDEVFTDCLPCNEQCPGFGPEICTLQCTSGCACKPGYSRMEGDGRCIPSIQCPQIDPIDFYPDPYSSVQEPQPQTCDVNEQYTTCGGCEETCQSLTEPLFCADVCVVGCQCLPGYVRNNGACVEPSQCPVGLPVDLSSMETSFSTVDEEESSSDDGEKESVDIEDILTDEEESDSMTCPVNEVFRQCKGCDQTCESLNNPIMCSMVCIPGCSCEQGFVRKDDVCVEPTECPVESSSVLKDVDLGSYDQVYVLPKDFNVEDLKLTSDAIFIKGKRIGH